MTTDINSWFFILLPVVAFLYASVGHGGASGYLALMALFNFSPDVMRPTALILNIFVSAIAFYHFYKAGNMRWKLFFALIILSVPFAYLGGTMALHQTFYRQILGLLLLIPVARFIWVSKKENENLEKINWPIVILLGACIGFISGLIGIGGGIILSPILLMLAWCKMKETAAISALFITINSVAGLAGNAKLGIHINWKLGMVIILAFAGGMLGAYIGANLIKTTRLKQLLALVLAIASFKLLMT